MKILYKEIALYLIYIPDSSLTPFILFTPEEVEPIGENILFAMFTGVVFVVPIWIVYGLTIYVVKGFKGQKRGSRNAKR